MYVAVSQQSEFKKIHTHATKMTETPGIAHAEQRRRPPYTEREKREKKTAAGP